MGRQLGGHDLAELLQAVVPHARVHPGVQGQGEVPQGPAAVEAAEVDGHRDLHGLLPTPIRPLLRLPAEDGLGHDRRQKDRYRGLVSVGGLDEGVGGNDPGGQMEKVGLVGAPQLQGVGLPVVEGDSVAVAEKAVLQLLGSGGLPPVQDPLLRRDLQAVLQAQIAGGQGLQIAHSPGAVGEGVEELHRDPVLEVHDPQAAGTELLLLHQGQGVGIVLPDLWRGWQLLQIIPEDAGPQPHVHGREAGSQLLHRPLEDGGVHGLGQGGRDPEHVDPAPMADGGKDQSGVVQPHPVFTHCFRDSSSESFDTVQQRTSGAPFPGFCSA